MKTIKILLVLQTMLLLVLVFDSFTGEDPAGDDTNRASALEVTRPEAGTGVTEERAPEFSGFDERRLRQIVRTELASALAASDREKTNSLPPVGEIDPVENQRRLEFVTDALSQYYLAGEISDEEMVHLQSEIAQLDPESRSLLMNELERAIFTGRIKGGL